MTWHTLAVIEVRGIPKAQPRPRAFSFKGKDGQSRIRMYEKGTAEAWKSEIACAALEHLPTHPLDGPVSMSVDFFLPRPQRLCRRKDPVGLVLHTGRPDRDNLDKAVLDALTHLGFWQDDSQVCAGSIRKFYHRQGGIPGARITIKTLVPPRHEELFE